MAFKTKLQDAEAFDIFGSALANAEAKPAIAKVLSEIGYDSETLNKGKMLLNETRAAFGNFLEKKGRLRTLQDDFTSKKDALSESFELHRKKARLVYRKDTGKLDLLGVSGPVPRIYPNWIEAINHFYTVASSDQGIQEDLAKVKLTVDDINEGLARIQEVVGARAEQLNAKGESQSSTERKDQLFINLRDWMAAFYQAARISMTSSPQMLESLGKVVK